MSPAYRYVSLALVKCSNEGGPGPRYNMKEVTGSSTLMWGGVIRPRLGLLHLDSQDNYSKPIIAEDWWKGKRGNPPSIMYTLYMTGGSESIWFGSEANSWIGKWMSCLVCSACERNFFQENLKNYCARGGKSFTYLMWCPYSPGRQDWSLSLACVGEQLCC